jgi:NTE family protein
MNVNLVFEGGGILGLYYIGAYKALKEYGYSIKRCAGTSAGSVISAAITAGYSATELENIIYETDFSIFSKKTKLSKIPLAGKPLSIAINKGLYDYRAIELWINDLLMQKRKVSFKDVMENGKSNLKIIAADITRSKMLILPDDLIEYGLNPAEYSIGRAVAMSCAIPYFFTPVKLNALGKANYIVDGGLLSNFPIWIFDNEGPLTSPTIGIKIKNLASNTSRGKRGIISYTQDIINAPINQDESNFVRNKDLVRTIVIDYDGKIKATDFNKVNKYKMELISKGYESSRRFLDKNIGIQRKAFG